MSPYLSLPQTPSAKTGFDEHVAEVVAGSGRSASPAAPRHRSLSPSGVAASKPIGGGGGGGATAITSIPTASSLAPPGLPAPDSFHRISIGSFSDAGHGPAVYAPSPPPSPRPSAAAAAAAGPDRRPFWARFWARNSAVLYVLAAQLFSALMNLFARLLELEGGGHSLHPVQLLFVRMVATTVASCLYMWYYRVPHFPLGPPGVRLLLVARGLTGFFGIFGMWYSMMYLPLAEATVFTFLAPSVAGFICHLVLHDPFTRREQIASVVALLGVVLITRPLSLFSSAAAADADEVLAANATTIVEIGARAAAGAGARAVNATLSAAAAAAAAASPAAAADTDGVSTHQRLVAIGVALLGVLGSSLVYTLLRAIGTRAHALISVNYFSTWCTIVTGSLLTFAPMLGVGQPYLRFVLPASLHQWVLLVLISICGFCFQFLATLGLGAERSNRATAMIYTQMLFAAGFDRFVFGHEMGLPSLVGGGLIIGSALWTALSKKPPPNKAATTTAAAAAAAAAAEMAPSSAPRPADIEFGIIDTARGAHRTGGHDAADGPREEGIPMLASAADSSDDEAEGSEYRR